jgi:predicted Ser/Thr protein kinase
VDETVIGSVLAGHRIDEVAGRGGMGVVYRATDLALDRRVAVKLITPALVDDPGFRRRFASESKLAASLDHPNVIPIYHAGEQDGVLFQVMRYVEGEDLRSVLKREERITPDRAARIVAQVASALDAAHARGLVHRDVKPANVLLAAGDHAYLTDFGLSKRLGAGDDTTPGEILGTTSYISPEQIRGGEVDARTDVYALGAMLFHMLTGRTPFPLDNQEARLWAHLSEPPPLASHVCEDVPAGFDAVITRAMSKDRADRHSSAGELAGVALVAASGAPTPTPDSDPGYRRALVTRSLADPFSLAVTAPVILAGVLFGRLWLALAAALCVYVAGVVRAYHDEDVREAVAARLRPAESEHPGVSDEIQRLLLSAARIHRRIQDAIARADLPYAEVSSEVDRLLATMHEAAGRAQLLEDGLEDAPPEAVAARLEAVKGDPEKTELVEALARQLAVQRRMERQLRGFYDGMERMLVDLDTVRGNLISVTAVPMADNQTLVAGEVRELRDDMDAVAEGIAAVYADQGETTAVKAVP